MKSNLSINDIVSTNKLLNCKIVLVIEIRQVNRKPYLTILNMQIVLIHHSKHMKSKIQTHRLIDNHVCALETEKSLVKILQLSLII